MVSAFEKAFVKLSLLGQNQKDMVDCSEVIPQPPAVTGNGPHLPAGKTMADIEHKCLFEAYPTLTANPGPESSIPPV